MSARRSSTWSISALPPTCTRGFGASPLNARMRVPRPAASTIARSGAAPRRRRVSRMNAPRWLPPSGRAQCRNVLAVPVVERRQRWMRQRTLKVAPYARHVTQILRLAVAPVEPRKNAEDLARALRRQRHVEPDELRAVEIAIGCSPPAQIAAQQSELGRFRHTHAGIPQQRCQIVGRRPDHRILEIQDAEPGETLAIR